MKNKLTPFYWRERQNFGDALNQILWRELYPNHIVEGSDTRLIGVGSLIKSSLSSLPGNKVIFGSGSGYGNPPSKEEFQKWQIVSVRGPLTSKMLELDSSKSIVDGAWLLKFTKHFSMPTTRGSRPVFVPHWTTALCGIWDKVCEDEGLDFIHPIGEPLEVLEKIKSASIVVTESLHGAIFADLFRIPWIPVKIGAPFLEFKWVDWFQSVGVSADIQTLPYINRFESKLQGFSSTADHQTTSKRISPGSHTTRKSGGLMKVLKPVAKKHADRLYPIARWAQLVASSIPPLNDGFKHAKANMRRVLMTKPVLSDEAAYNQTLERLGQAHEEFRRRLESDSI